MTMQQERGFRLDLQALADLKDLEGAVGESLLGALVQEYSNKSRGLLHQIHAGVALGDRDRVRFAAHSLKSSSAALGGCQLAEVCGRIERRAEEGEPVENLVSEIELAQALLDLTVVALRTYVSGAARAS